jgi:recombination protein RecT
VLKQVIKYAPKKSEFARALASDETIKTNIQPNMVDVNDETEPINVTPMEEVKEELPDGMQEPEIVPFGDED